MNRRFQAYLMRLLSLLLFGSGAAWLPAQNVSYRQYTTRDGLPGNIIYDIAQDHQGYLWLATDMGLSQFDGHSFRNYGYAEGVTDLEIMKVAVDARGQVWAGAFQGDIMLYNGEKILSLRTLYPSLSPKLVSNVVSMSASHGGGMWISNRNGTNFFLQNTIPTLIFTEDSTFYKSSITVSRGTYFLGNHGVGGFAAPGEMRINPFGTRPDILNQRHLLTCVPGTDTIIEYNDLGLKLLVPLDADENLLVTPLPPVADPSTVNGMDFDEDRNFWLLSRNGVYLNEDLMHGGHYEKILDGIFSNCHFQDREGTHWLGTREGLLRIIFPEARGILLRGPAGAPERIKSMEGAGGKLWLGTQQGHIYMASGTQNVSFLALDIQQGEINRIEALETGLLNVLTTNTILVLDTQGTVQAKYGHISRPFGFARIGQDSIVLAYINGLRLLADKDYAVYFRENEYIHNYTVPDIFRRQFSDMQLLGNHEIMAIRSRYLGIWNYKTNEVRTLPGEEWSEWPLREMHMDAAGTLWLLTEGRGLLACRDGACYNWTRAEGLVDDHAVSLKFHQGKAWLATGFGLYRMNPNPPFGPQSIEAAYYAGMHLPDIRFIAMCFVGDTMALASPDFLCYFHPNQLKVKAQSLPKVLLTEVNVMGRKVPLSRELSLPYDSAYVTLNYTCMSFLTNGNAAFRYRSTGGSGGWQYTDSRQLEFPALEPGDYPFEIQARSADGRWSPDSARILVHITPPWWRSWGFVIAFPLSLVIISVLILIAIFRARRRRYQLNYARSLSEQKALRAQMNPHFIFNSLASIQRYVVQENKVKALEYLGDFGVLIRKILENSKEEYIPLSEEIEFLELYMELEALRSDHKFTWQIETAAGLNPGTLQIPPTLIQPILENSILHGILPLEGQGHIAIHIQKADEYLLISVRDNGIGRERSREIQKKGLRRHKSMGMDITLKRLQLLRTQKNDSFGLEITDLYGTTGETAGTEVILRIPYKEMME